MSQRTKTLLPTNKNLLKPRIVEGVPETLKVIEEKEKFYACTSKNELPDYEEKEKNLVQE